MEFRSGIPVKDGEISDITACSRASGILRGLYSLICRAAAFAGIWSSTAAILLIAAGVLPGLPLLMAAYRRIYDRYKVC